MEDEFDGKFKMAQKLALKNDRIVLASSGWERTKNAFRLTPREIAIVVISTIITVLLTLLPVLLT